MPDPRRAPSASRTPGPTCRARAFLSDRTGSGCGLPPSGRCLRGARGCRAEGRQREGVPSCLRAVPVRGRTYDPYLIEVFTIGTRLTREMTHRDPDTAPAAVAAAVFDRSGGTRLGGTPGAFLDTGPARHRTWNRGRRALRRPGARLPRAPRGSDAAAAPAGTPGGAVQPAPGRTGLRATGRRHGCSAAPRERVRRGKQPAGPGAVGGRRRRSRTGRRRAPCVRSSRR